VPSLLRSLTERRPAGDDPARMTLEQYAQTFDTLLSDWQGTNPNLITTWRNEPAERIGSNMAALAAQAYQSNGLAFSVIAVRMVAFSLVRFSWQRMRGGRPGDLFGTPALMPLETPQPGQTAQDLLARMLQDVDLAGNAYVVRDGPWCVRLRPDWVQILLEPIELKGGIVGYRKHAYTYHHGGIENCPPEQVALFAPSEICHFMPTPDPTATFRGMSWLNPVIREITNDKTMERHKTRFFENAAVPNLAVSLDKSVSAPDFARFKEVMDAEHAGLDNAGKTLYLGGGADVKVIGANLQQLDFSTTQGRGETRVAAAGGVPPILVGLSEGLSASTYSNYGQAMRRFADLTMASLWGNAAGSLATILTTPGTDARLWYDVRDVAFLRDEAKARAEVQQIRASVINVYITAGFTPESAIAAAVNEDETMLIHSGLVSVQLQPPGGPPPAPAAKPAPAGPIPAAKAPAAKAPAAKAPTKADAGGLDDVDRELAATGDHPALTNGAHP
jgi:phage portal protein BeeE